MSLFGHETPPQVWDMLERKIIETKEERLRRAEAAPVWSLPLLPLRRCPLPRG